MVGLQALRKQLANLPFVKRHIAPEAKVRDGALKETVRRVRRERRSEPVKLSENSVGYGPTRERIVEGTVLKKLQGAGRIDSRHNVYPDLSRPEFRPLRDHDGGATFCVARAKASVPIIGRVFLSQADSVVLVLFVGIAEIENGSICVVQRIKLQINLQRERSTERPRRHVYVVVHAVEHHAARRTRRAVHSGCTDGGIVGVNGGHAIAAPAEINLVVRHEVVAACSDDDDLISAGIGSEGERFKTACFSAKFPRGDDRR